MKCSNCGFENRPNARFCKQCGQPLEEVSADAGVACPACGARNKPGARFCRQCGQALPAAPKEAARPAEITCAACGTRLKPQARFCPHCGQPVATEPIPPPSLKAAQPAAPSTPPVVSKMAVAAKAESGGQIATDGGVNIRIGSINGGQVNISVPKKAPPVRRRSWPVSLPPPTFAGLLDREAEVRAANTALRSSESVEFYGQAGLGKTTLLKVLAHQELATAFPQGIVYLSLLHQPPTDLLQYLFDTFYERDKDYKPSDPQIRHALKDIRALIVLDDVSLGRDELTALLNGAPNCTFFLASSKRSLWGQGSSMALPGLPPAAALTLVERELGRVLTDQERPPAQSLCEVLKGHPFHLLRAATLVRQQNLSMIEILQRVQQIPSPTRALTTQLLGPLSEKARQVLAALAALDGVTLRTEHLAALVGLSDAAPVLESLLQQGLVQAHSPRFSLTGDLGQTLQQEWDLTTWTERALAYFTAWAEARQSVPEELVTETAPMLQLLEWAVGTHKWTEVVRLGRSMEGALALSGQWQAWNRVLQWILQAARELANQAVEAWTLHQLGSQALCLRDAAAAQSYLEQALQLRQTLGDQAGAALTRHNLDQLVALSPPPKPPAKPAAKPAPAPKPFSPILTGVIGLAAVAAVVVVGLGIWYILQPPPATPVVDVTNTPTPTKTSTPAFTSTFTPTPTSTRTPTPTITPTRTAEMINSPTSTRTATPTRTPTSTKTPTNTPTWTATHTPTFTPTRIPTSTPTDTPTPTFTPIPVIVFEPEFARIDFGDCILLEWFIENVNAAYLSGGRFQELGVGGPTGEEEDCPQRDTTYTLRVVLPDNSEEFYDAVIEVNPPPVTPPDLVITSLNIPDRVVNSGGKITVPLRVTITNQGDTSADIFKVATEYLAGGTFGAPFTVPGQSNSWYPYTSSFLSPGKSVTFDGDVILPISLQGQTVAIVAIADSCAGDEFMPDYCRVEESNEGNNDTFPLLVDLPFPTVD